MSKMVFRTEYLNELFADCRLNKYAFGKFIQRMKIRLRATIYIRGQNWVEHLIMHEMNSSKIFQSYFEGVVLKIESGYTCFCIYFSSSSFLMFHMYNAYHKKIKIKIFNGPKTIYFHLLSLHKDKS